jgi:hypothetical protein
MTAAHPHESTQWSPHCLACPAEQPPGTVEVDLDAPTVTRMEDEAAAPLTARTEETR